MPDTRSPYPRRRNFTNWPKPWRYSWLAWPLLGVISKSEIKALGIMVKYIDIPACSLLYSARDKLRAGDSGSEPSGGKSRRWMRVRGQDYVWHPIRRVIQPRYVLRVSVRERR